MHTHTLYGLPTYRCLCLLFSPTRLPLSLLASRHAALLHADRRVPGCHEGKRHASWLSLWQGTGSARWVLRRLHSIILWACTAHALHLGDAQATCAHE